MCDRFKKKKKAISDCVSVHKQSKPEEEDEVDKFEDPQKDGAKKLLENSAAAIIRYLSEDQNSRGILVQQGGLRLLVNMHADVSEKSAIKTGVAIARILIVVNPHLVPDEIIPSCIPIMIKTLKETGFFNKKFSFCRCRDLLLNSFASPGYYFFVRSQ